MAHSKNAFFGVASVLVFSASFAFSAPLVSTSISNPPSKITPINSPTSVPEPGNLPTPTMPPGYEKSIELISSPEVGGRLQVHDGEAVIKRFVSFSAFETKPEKEMIKKEVTKVVYALYLIQPYVFPIRPQNQVGKKLLGTFKTPVDAKLALLKSKECMVKRPYWYCEIRPEKTVSAEWVWSGNWITHRSPVEAERLAGMLNDTRSSVYAEAKQILYSACRAVQAAGPLAVAECSNGPEGVSNCISPPVQDPSLNLSPKKWAMDGIASSRPDLGFMDLVNMHVLCRQADLVYKQDISSQ